jgi:protein-L-isoaspartate(D-aspartate) O-methyltransferase
MRHGMLLVSLAALLQFPATHFAVSEAGAQGREEDFSVQRARMAAEIDAIAHETRTETGRARFSAAVMASIAKVPRHQFVPLEQVRNAYRNSPLPIGHGQTISQPYIVALSTDLAELRPEHVVLEIGTGSGYQAAVLAGIVRQVYSIELLEPLGREAAERLARLGYSNVETRIGDGYQGWPERSPFDAIIVTAAAPSIPPALVAQLKVGGRLVIPVGAMQEAQELLVVTKRPGGVTETRKILPVRFVPLVPGR